MRARKGYSKAVQVGAETLTSLLAEKLRGKAVYGFVWRLERIAWVKGESGKAILFPLGSKEKDSPVEAVDLVGQWTQARLFDEKSELRWCKGEGGMYDLLSLAEVEEELAEVGEEVEPTPWEVVEPGMGGKPAHLLLAGSIKDEEHENVWIETRFPNPLLYPVGEKEDKHPPSVHYYEYRDEGSGTVQFLRFLEVK